MIKVNSRHVRYLGLIPARKGSKGIPGKNMVDLGGRPLLEWTLDAARLSQRLNDRILTCDDPAMMAIARRLSVPAPFERPAHLCTDSAHSIDVVLHTLGWLAEDGCDVETVVLLQPTCPFRDAVDIDSSIEAFERSGASSLVSVSPASQHPCDMVRVEHGRLVRAVDHADDGRQAFPEYWFLDGAIYITRSDVLREHRQFWNQSSAIHRLAPMHGLDIDEAHQLRVARGLLAL